MKQMVISTSLVKHGGGSSMLWVRFSSTETEPKRVDREMEGAKNRMVQVEEKLRGCE